MATNPTIPHLVAQVRVPHSDYVVTLLHEDDRKLVDRPWIIWLGLETGDPRQQNESFIIGQAITANSTRRKAIEALTELINAIVALPL